MIKPTGAICNLDCRYCFFLSKEKLYPGSEFRMPESVLEAFTQQYIEAQRVPGMSFAWQGGEPTLMGLDFFRRAMELQQAYQRPGVAIENTLQTNGILLDDEWGEFLHEHNFLVGISIDGPRELHDAYRVDKGGKPSFDRVMRGLEVLKKHDVEFNILCTVHAANGDHPVDVYRFFRDALGAKFIQFIAIVERDNETGFQEGNKVTDRSVKPKQYGRFLNGVFDEWVRRDVAQVYLQMFDVALGAWYGEGGAACVFAPTCGTALALEHTGDLYACDHFVEPDYHLGNITDQPLAELVGSEAQRRFGLDKRDKLPKYCRECDVRFACQGGCPKNRFDTTPDGEPGLNYLCAGYKAFFRHIDLPMRIMTAMLRQDRAPAEVMRILPVEEARLGPAFAEAQGSEPCPCGSGRKFRQCHGPQMRAATG
jgi:uncharacterized protein